MPSVQKCPEQLQNNAEDHPFKPQQCLKVCGGTESFTWLVQFDLLLSQGSSPGS